MYLILHPCNTSLFLYNYFKSTKIFLLDRPLFLDVELKKKYTHPLTKRLSQICRSISSISKISTDNFQKNCHPDRWLTLSTIINLWNEGSKGREKRRKKIEIEIRDTCWFLDPSVRTDDTFECPPLPRIYGELEIAKRPSSPFSWIEFTDYSHGWEWINKTANHSFVDGGAR